MLRHHRKSNNVFDKWHTEIHTSLLEKRNLAKKRTSLFPYPGPYYLDVLDKWHEFLHSAFDFRYYFHPVHDVPVIGEVSSQLIVHLPECVQRGVLPSRVRAGNVDDSVSWSCRWGCIFLWEMRKNAEQNLIEGSGAGLYGRWTGSWCQRRCLL